LRAACLAEDHGDDEQVHLVGEVVIEQPPDQGAAAVHLQLTPRLGFQLADGRRDGTGGRSCSPSAVSASMVDTRYLGLCVQGICDLVVARIFRRGASPLL